MTMTTNQSNRTTEHLLSTNDSHELMHINLGVCPDCGELVDYAECIAVDGEPVCIECMTVREYLSDETGFNATMASMGIV